MIQQNLFGDLLEEKKGELEFKNKNGNIVKVVFTIAGGEDNTGFEGRLKEIADLIDNKESAMLPPETKESAAQSKENNSQNKDTEVSALANKPHNDKQFFARPIIKEE